MTSDLRKNSIVLVEARVLHVLDGCATVTIDKAAPARHLKISIDDLKGIVTRPFEAGDKVRWYPEDNKPNYLIGTFVGMLRDCQIAICRNGSDLFEVPFETLKHEDLKL